MSISLEKRTFQNSHQAKKYIEADKRSVILKYLALAVVTALVWFLINQAEINLGSYEKLLFLGFVPFIYKFTAKILHKHLVDPSKTIYWAILAMAACCLNIYMYCAQIPYPGESFLPFWPLIPAYIPFTLAMIKGIRDSLKKHYDSSDAPRLFDNVYHGILPCELRYGKGNESIEVRGKREEKPKITDLLNRLFGLSGEEALIDHFSSSTEQRAKVFHSFIEQLVKYEYSRESIKTAISKQEPSPERREVKKFLLSYFKEPSKKISR